MKTLCQLSVLSEDGPCPAFLVMLCLDLVPLVACYFILREDLAVWPF